MPDLKTAAQPGVYYHVTSYANWPAIRDSGLRPGADGHVWLFTEAEAAMRFKDAWDSTGWRTGVPPEQWKAPPCIIVVRTDRAVPTQAGIPGAYWVEGPTTKAEVYDVIRPEDMRHYASKTAAVDLSVVEDIVQGLRGSSGQLGICGRATQVVQQRLGFPKVEGFYSGPDATGRTVWIPHAWNVLPNGDILDPTSDQFGFEMVRVIPRAEAGAYQPFTTEQQRAREEFRGENMGRDPDPQDWAFLASKTAAEGWHYAPRSAREDIETHGLDWRRSPAARRPQDPRNRAPVANYFSPSEEVAREMGLGADYDLYEVDLTGIPTTPDPYQPEDALYTLDAIPRDRLRRVAAEDHSEHAMICLRPSEATRKVFADMDEATESVDDLHVTLYYLGTLEEAGGPLGKERIYRGLYDFAIHSGYTGLTGKVNGYGTFLNDDANVLIALWDIPGIAEFRTRLMDYVKNHGVEPRTDDHGFTPHMTLDFPEQPPTSLPKIPSGAPDEETFDSVWLVWGEEWTEVALL